jgi:hypothetical protein
MCRCHHDHVKVCVCEQVTAVVRLTRVTINRAASGNTVVELFLGHILNRLRGMHSHQTQSVCGVCHYSGSFSSPTTEQAETVRRPPLKTTSSVLTAKQFWMKIRTSVVFTLGSLVGPARCRHVTLPRTPVRPSAWRCWRRRPVLRRLLQTPVPPPPNPTAAPHGYAGSPGLAPRALASREAAALVCWRR